MVSLLPKDMDRCRTYSHIIELVLIGAPYRIVQIVTLANNTQSLVGVVEDPLGVIAVEAELALGDGPSPVLNVNVFAGQGRLSKIFYRQWNGSPVKICPERRACQ